MDRSALFQAFHRDGFAVIENFFPLPLIERFETAIHRVATAELTAIGESRPGMTAVEVCSIIGLFWNQKSNARLQYDWHQESTDYVDFDWSFHGWFPLFADVPLERGPMVVAKGSHGQNYPYEMYRKRGAGTQLRPLIDVDAQFEAVPLPVKRGDLILFHHALIHRTGQNQTDVPRVSGILRFTPAIARKRYMPMIRYQYADEGHKDRVQAKAARYIEE